MNNAYNTHGGELGEVDINLPPNLTSEQWHNLFLNIEKIQNIQRELLHFKKSINGNVKTLDGWQSFYENELAEIKSRLTTIDDEISSMVLTRQTTAESLERRLDYLMEDLTTRGVGVGFESYAQMNCDAFEKLIDNGLEMPLPELRALRIVQRMDETMRGKCIRTPIVITTVPDHNLASILVARSGDSRIKAMLCHLEERPNIDHKEIKYAMQIAALKMNGDKVPSRSELNGIKEIRGPLIFKKIFKLNTFPTKRRGIKDEWHGISGDSDVKEISGRNAAHVGQRAEYVLFAQQELFDTKYPDLFRLHELKERKSI